MKKIFCILSILLAFNSLKAQNPKLTDGSFENWIELKGFTGNAYHDLDTAINFWTTLNFVSSLPPELSTGPVTAFREEGRTGGYCAKVVSKPMTVGTQDIFLPGVVGNMTVIFEEETAQFGRPFNGRPDSLIGYFKYAPVNGDSAEIFVEMSKYNEGFHMVIGTGSHKIKTAVNDWTRFSFPIQYTSDATPDSITILSVASAGYNFVDLFTCQGQEGSTLWVDDYELFYKGTAIENAEKAVEISVYPNPAKDMIHFNFKSNLPSSVLHIFDINGRLVAKQNVSGSQASINLEKFANGIYGYSIQNSAQNSHSGRFIIQR